jgi:hypothetical protein
MRTGNKTTLDGGAMAIRRKLMAGVTILGMLSGIGAGTAGAAVLAEVGDAGDLPETAQSSEGVEPFGTPLNAITGVITDGLDNDMFKIHISDPANFSATTTNGGTTVDDTMLYLFDESGLGVLANDDTDATTNFTSTLSAGSLTGNPAGVYYIAVTVLFNSPLSSGGDVFDLSELEATTLTIGPDVPGGGEDPVNAWDNIPFAFTGPENYQIDLIGATFVAAAAPVPSLSNASILVLCAAILVLGTFTSRRIQKRLVRS